MSEAGSTEASNALPKYKNQQLNVDGRLQLEQRMRSNTCTTRSQPVELVTKIPPRVLGVHVVSAKDGEDDALNQLK